MEVKHLFRPFHEITARQKVLIVLMWAVLVIGYWFHASQGDKHLFPTPVQVWNGFIALWQEGLLVHVFSSLGLCFKSMAFALLLSLGLAYASPLPILKPVSELISKFRYLPLVGLTYYMTVLVKDARSMQIGVLTIFMSTYFVTSLLAMIRDVPQEEIDHARSLRCTRWEVLLEVVIKGRLDYVLDILRQNLAIIWMMLVTVESILVASGGIGVLIKNSDKFFIHGRVVALQIVILLLGLFLDWAINALRTTLFRYAR